MYTQSKPCASISFALSASVAPGATMVLPVARSSRSFTAKNRIRGQNPNSVPQRQTMYSLAPDLMIGEPLELYVTCIICGAQLKPSSERCSWPFSTFQRPCLPPPYCPATEPAGPEL